MNSIASTEDEERGQVEASEQGHESERTDECENFDHDIVSLCWELNCGDKQGEALDTECLICRNKVSRTPVTITPWKARHPSTFRMVIAFGYTWYIVPGIVFY